MRKYNIDFIKTLAIFFVICVHFHFNNLIVVDGDTKINFYYIIRNLFSVAVPLFLVTSGYLLITKEYSYKSIFIKILQFIILAILSKFISLLVMGGHLSIKSIVQIILDVNVKEATIGDYRTNYLWYIYAYIGVLLLQPVLHQLYKNKKVYLTFALICIIYAFGLFYLKLNINDLGTSIKANSISSTFPLNATYCYVYGFFFIGTLFRMYEDKIINFIKHRNIKKLNITAIVLIIISLLLTAFATASILNFLNVSDNPVTYNYQTPFGLILTSLIFTWLMYLVPTISNKTIIFISKNTLGIFLVHWPIEYIIKKYAFEIPAFQSVFADTIISVFVLIVCTLFVYLLQKNKYTAKLVTI